MKTIIGWACGALLSLMATTAVAQPDMSIAITGPAGPIAPGDLIIQTVKLTNTGSITVSSSYFVYILPGELDYQDAAFSTGPCHYEPPNQVTCIAGPLAPGSSASGLVHGRLNASAIPNSTVVSRVTVYSIVPDADSSNDSSATSFTVAPPPPAPVPTLSEWAMIALSVLLAGGAALHLERRRRAA